MNKKGFTLVETLVSFVLVSVISIFLFQIVVIIRNIYIEKGVKTELYVEQSIISNTINKDIYTNIDSGNYLTSIVKNSNTSLTFTFSNGTSKLLTVDLNTKTITYGDNKQVFMNGCKIGNITVTNKYEVLSGVTYKDNGIVSVTVPITYKDYKEDFGVRLTTRYNTSLTSVTG